MTEEEKKAIEKLEMEGTENNYLEVKIVLDLIDKQQEIIKNQSYTNKKLRNKIKTVRKERNKLQADIEIKDKVIDYMAKEINKAYYDENHFYLFFEGNFDDKNLPKRINKIKQYFYKKVEEENE